MSELPHHARLIRSSPLTPPRFVAELSALSGIGGHGGDHGRDGPRAARDDRGGGPRSPRRCSAPERAACLRLPLSRKRLPLSDPARLSSVGLRTRKLPGRAIRARDRDQRGRDRRCARPVTRFAGRPAGRDQPARHQPAHRYGRVAQRRRALGYASRSICRSGPEPWNRRTPGRVRPRLARSHLPVDRVRADEWTGDRPQVQLCSATERRAPTKRIHGRRRREGP
jgi:hypothetical protein